MKDFFHVVTTVVLIALGAVTVWLMVKDRKRDGGCSCKQPKSGGNLEPPSCGIGYNRGKKHIGLVK